MTDDPTWRGPGCAPQLSRCNKCGAEYPSAPPDHIHKCGNCSGICKPVGGPVSSINGVATGADTEQFGGNHYKLTAISPWNIVDTWPLAERIGFYRGNALKYTMRMHDKDAPVDNIEKAGHYCRKLAEVLREAETRDGAFHHPV